MEPSQAEAHFLSGRRIAVAGAGMAGLSFTLALHQQFVARHPSLPPPSVTIYDRDTRAVSIGREGYSLSIVGDTADGGLHTLSQLGLLDKTLGCAIIGAEGAGSFKVWTERWQELISIKMKPFNGLPTSSIRIARKDLRQLLLDAVTETGTRIRWGTSCVGVDRLEDSRLKVRIIDHDTGEDLVEEYDMLVAADGSSSKLRTQLRPQDDLEYAGAVQMGGVAKYEDGLPAPVDLNWGGILTGRGVFVFFSPVSDTELVWALSIRDKSLRPKYDAHNPTQVAAMLAEAAELGKSISNPWPEIVKRTVPETTLMLAARDKKPFENNAFTEEWGPVIFIGDANHAISPFGGNGANLALRDGWDLAERLCLGNRLKEAVRDYDKLSGPRAIATLKSSHQRIGMGHSTGVSYWMYRILFMIGGAILKVVGRS